MQDNALDALFLGENFCGFYRLAFILLMCEGFFHFPPQSPSGLQEVLYEFCRLFDPCFLALGQNNFHLAARGALLLLRSCRAPFQVLCLSSIRQFRSLLPQVSSFFKEKSPQNAPFVLLPASRDMNFVHQRMCRSRA